jgi:hypothetical protein
MHKLLLASLLVVFSSPVLADQPQQDRMKACNADAAKQELKGDARKQFMKECLATKKDRVEDRKTADADKPREAGEEKQLTAQQQRMKTCNADAKAQSLSGEARKAFMKSCLSGR